MKIEFYYAGKFFFTFNFGISFDFRHVAPANELYDGLKKID